MIRDPREKNRDGVGLMSDIAELEARMTAALDRVEAAFAVLGERDSGDAPRLREELEAERTANAQLEERVRAIKDRQETTVAGLEAEVARLRQALASRDGELARMRAANEELRASNAALREANAQGLADAALVDGGLRAELESLRGLRKAERAEIEEILATLEPVLKEA